MLTWRVFGVQVQYKKRYIGLFATAEQAAAAWNAAAAADGVPPEQLNALPAPGGGHADEGGAMVAGGAADEDVADVDDVPDAAAIM